MNTYTHKILSILLAIFFLSSCSKTLDSKPFSFNTAENFYKTAQDAELGLTGVYSILNAQGIQGTGGGWNSLATFKVTMPVMLSTGTDEALTLRGSTGIDIELDAIGIANATSQNEGIRFNWFYLFAGINRANYLLQKVPTIDMNPTRKEQILGEGHFLRGLLYMYLAAMYGGVPIYTDIIHDPKSPRESLEKVYQLIISDFEFAYAKLPHRASITGRANKWSSAGFLAKVYAYLASCKLNNVGKDLNFPINSFDWVNATVMYENTKTISADIIDNSGYKLIDKYDYLFRETTNTFQAQESLFSVISSSNASTGNNNMWLFWQIPVGNLNTNGGGNAMFRPTGEMFLKYNALDIRRDHNLTWGILYAPLVKETIEGVPYYACTKATNNTNGAYCISKFRYRDPATKTITKSMSEGDYPLLRYADILLIYAEALYQTGNEPGAREMFLTVRKRAARSEADLVALTTSYFKSNFINELIDERSRELCFENWRRIDLTRFGIYSSSIANLNKNVGVWNLLAVPIVQNNWKSYKIWFPIPRTEIELSNIKQNPGYSGE